MYPLDRTTVFGKAGAHYHLGDKNKCNSKIGKQENMMHPDFFATFDATASIEKSSN